METRIIRPGTGEIIETGQAQPFQILDVYGDSPVAEDSERIDWLATISAGTRQKSDNGKPGLPMMSRDGRYYLHDPNNRAPKLKEECERRLYRTLTIAFTSNEPGDFIQQRFRLYSASAVIADGDQFKIVVRDPETKARTTYYVGSDEYEQWRRKCKATQSIYFVLAKWGHQGGEPYMPDGLAHYRIRSSSRNTIRNLWAAIKQLQRVNRGHIMGVPFDIGLDMRDVQDPKGDRRNVACWTFTVNPPGGINYETLVPLMLQTIKHGELLQLPEPAAQESMEDADADFYELADESDIESRAVVTETDIDVEAARTLSEGGLCDARAFEAQWFALVRSTPYAEDEARADLLSAYTDGTYDSLATFLADASEASAAAFYAYTLDLIDAWRRMEDRKTSTVPTGRAALALSSLDDGYIPTSARPVDEAPFFDRPMLPSDTGDEHDLLPVATVAVEEFKPHLAAQRTAIERLASPKVLQALSWERLSFDDAAQLIESLQA